MDDDDDCVEVGPLSDFHMFEDGLYRLSGQEPPKYYMRKSDLRDLKRFCLGAMAFVGLLAASNAYVHDSFRDFSWKDVYKGFANGAYAASASYLSKWDPPYKMKE